MIWLGFFFPYQGDSGDYNTQEIKGEQGIIGFPGVRVDDINKTEQYR